METARDAYESLKAKEKKADLWTPQRFELLLRESYGKEPELEITGDSSEKPPYIDQEFLKQLKERRQSQDSKL